MKFKNLVSCIYLKDGQAYSGYTKDSNPCQRDVMELTKAYSDCGVDQLFVFDLADGEAEHDKNLGLLKSICINSEIPVAAGGRILRLEDIKKYLYAGCMNVILNGSKPETATLLKEGSARFGKEKVMLSLENVDILFKQRELVEECVDTLVILKEKIISAVENIIELPMIPIISDITLEKACEILLNEKVSGIGGQILDNPNTDVMEFKQMLIADRIEMNRLEPSLEWNSFQPNEAGLVPVIAQDYQTNEVLMLAYMNEEAFMTTLTTGKMTYYSRSRQELWTKGVTSGHFQYVKSLTADCDNDTILAKVSQIGAACHTGNHTCFFNEIIKKDYKERNPLLVFEEVYATIMDRKEHPKEGSYTNYLFDKGIDKILKKVGEESTEIVIAAKNPDADEIKYEISDFMYHVMVLMVERGVTWEDITSELAHRE